jgi:hypothetical protein
MSFETESVEVDGAQCRRIRIPRETHKWTSALDVDVERGWLPLRWQGWYRGKPAFSYTLTYGHDDDGTPQLTGWRYLHYSETGDLEQARAGAVTRNEINGDIDAHRFSLEFPVGAHVSRSDGTDFRYFVQTTDGLAPLADGQFGKVDIFTGE